MSKVTVSLLLFFALLLHVYSNGSMLSNNAIKCILLSDIILKLSIVTGILGYNPSCVQERGEGGKGGCDIDANKERRESVLNQGSQLS